MPLGRLTGPTASISNISLSPDGRRLASTDLDKGTLIWDVTNPGRPQRIGANLGTGRNLIARSSFGPDGTLVSATSGRVIRLWDLSEDLLEQVD